MTNEKKPDTQTISKLAAETGIQSEWSVLDAMECPYCQDRDNIYILDDKRTCYCLSCGQEFTLLMNGNVDSLELSDPTVHSSYLSDEYAEIQKEANRQVNTPLQSQIDEIVKNQSNQKVLPGFAPTYGGTNSSNTSTTGYSNYQHSKWCTHRPTHVIAGRGWGVYAGKKYDVEDSANDFDVVLNLTYTPIRERRVIPIPELQQWEYMDEQKYKEIQIDWPDYGISTLPRGFWVDLINYIKENQFKLLVFCQGGHGRTGTAVASMLVVSLGWTAQEAINWVRKNYCDEAIETKSQELYVQAIEAAGKKRRKVKKEKKASATN